MPGSDRGFRIRPGPRGISSDRIWNCVSLGNGLPIPKLIEFDLGYDYFFKGSYAERQAEIPGNPSARDSSYFYVQTEMRF